MPNDFKKALIKPLYEKGDKSEFGKYPGISLVSVGSKLLSSMLLFQQCGFRKGSIVCEQPFAESGVEQGFVLFPFIRIVLMDFVLRSTGKAMERTWNQIGGRDFPGLRLC